MTYNQKAWLGVVLLCGLFWAAVIGGASSLYKAERPNAPHQKSEFAARHGQAPNAQQSAQALTAPRNG
ncbi:hypothetical protein BHU62_08770 [Serratia marcescens]|uniref:Uncharacterized protein n=1 Tax=Serratia marcescens TaxID=615 RepID=A0A1Q4P1Z3_SERMA|nr:hypothetical protein [Serratia marcescens]OKB67137.1 hypothetical protein BHU62_08770 [Serratia marcescens]